MLQDACTCVPYVLTDCAYAAYVFVNMSYMLHICFRICGGTGWHWGSSREGKGSTRMEEGGPDLDYAHGGTACNYAQHHRVTSALQSTCPWRLGAKA